MDAAIYIDMIFLVEWGMQGFVLWMTGGISGFRTKWWRVVLGGFFSALIHCLLMIKFFYLSGSLIVVILLQITGILIAFYPTRIRNLLRLFLTQLLSVFLLGGMTQVLFVTTQAQRFFGVGRVVGANVFPWYYLIWGTIISYFVMKKAGRWLEAHIRRRRDFCSLSLWKGERRADAYVLIDTGNVLKKDEQGVVILSLETILPLFSAEEGVHILTGDRRLLISLGYTSLGNADDMLWGFYTDKVIVSFGEVQRNIGRRFIGISFDTFPGAYDGLVPPDMIEEDEI